MVFNFKKDLILENERVQLRPLSITDHAFLLPFSLKEPDLWTYSLTSAAGEEKLEKYLQSALEVRVVETGYPFLIFDKKNQKIAGSTGLNRHCKLLLLTHAFEALKMERVEFRADAKNAKSIAAMQGIGCTLEGTLRNNCTAEFGRRNSVVLSIIKSEWPQVKAALVAKTY